MPPCTADGSDDSDFTMDSDIVTNLLAPIISSQQFVLEELNNQYRCLICKNGFTIVLSQFFNHVFLAMNGDGMESEDFLRRKLAVLNRIIVFKFGPFFKELKLPTLDERINRWRFVHRLLNKWCQLYNTEQSFLCEAVEQVVMNPNISSQCMSLLESVHLFLNKQAKVKVSHVGLIIGTKWLSFFSGVEAPSLYTSDKLLLILLINTLYNRPSTTGRSAKPLKAQCNARDFESLLNRPLLNRAELSCVSETKNITRPLSEPSPAALKALYQSPLAVRRRFSTSSEAVLGQLSADSVLNSANSSNVETRLHDGDSQLLSDDVYEIRCGGNARADSPLTSTDDDDDLLDYRRIIVFLQEGNWKHCPSTVHCIAISCDITLVVLHEIEKKEHARKLSTLIDLINQVISGMWKTDACAVSDIPNNIESCVKSINVLSTAYSKVLDSSVVCLLVNELLKVWQSLKSIDFGKKLVSARISEANLEDTMMRLLRDMHGHALELFRILFFVPHPSKLQPCVLQDAKSLIEKSLLGFHEFVTVAAQNNTSCSSLLSSFPSLLHFIFIDRSSNLIMTPVLHRQHDNTTGQLHLTDNVWTQFCAMRRLLLSGHLSSTANLADCVYSYQVVFTDASGQLLSTNEYSMDSNHIVGTLCEAFYRLLMKKCTSRLTSSSTRIIPVRYYELFCVYSSPVSESFVKTENRRLVKQIYNLLSETRRTTIALF